MVKAVREQKRNEIKGSTPRDFSKTPLNGKGTANRACPSTIVKPKHK